MVPRFKPRLMIICGLLAAELAALIAVYGKETTREPNMTPESVP